MLEFILTKKAWLYFSNEWSKIVDKKIKEFEKKI